jgi:hypothetical protein
VELGVLFYYIDFIYDWSDKEIGMNQEEQNQETQEKHYTPEEREKYISELKASMAEEEKLKSKRKKVEVVGKGNPWVAALIIVLILAFLGFLVEQFSSEPATETQTPTQIEIYTTIGAGQLYQEYENNEIAADLKYEGRLLKVHGIVRRIGENIWGDPYVVIVENEGDFWGVQCTYPDTAAYRAQLAKYNPGQELTVTGRCKGGSIGSVLLEHE